MLIYNQSNSLSSHFFLFAGILVVFVPSFSAMNIYTTNIFLCAIITFLCSYGHSYVLIALYSAIFNMSVGCFCVKIPLVVIKILDIDLLASGYGYVMLFEAIGSLFGAPVAGLHFFNI